MQHQKKKTFRWLSVVLAANLATPESALLTTALPQAVIYLGSFALAGAATAGENPPATPGRSLEPTNAPGAPQLAAVPSDADLSATRVFGEPLIPLESAPVAGENEALAAALSAYASRTAHDDCSSLARFASAFPDARWTASLLLRLGAEYYNYGYFSKALDAWERSWKKFAANPHPPSKTQADLALGELARMYSRLGRMNELSRLLESSKDRDLEGPATQLIHNAKDALWTMQTRPDFSFGCGPSALDRILLRTDPTKAGNPALLEARSSTNGFSLSRVAELSRRLGMNYQKAFRSAGATFILPAVVHWKVDHYAALVERDTTSGRLLSQDYTFINTVWMTPTALEEEASGYFLVPAGPLPAGWRQVSDEEGQRIWGKGFVAGQNPDGTTRYDQRCRLICTNSPTGQMDRWLSGNPYGGIAPVGTPAPARPPGPPVRPAIPPSPVPTQTMPGDIAPVTGASRGMATYDMHAMLVSLAVDDTPIGYQPPVGPAVEFTASYHQREAGQPATFSYANLGQKWTFNWLSYITDNPFTPGSDVSLYVDGGGTLRFYNFNAGTQSYQLESMSQTRLVRLSTASYELQYPDGSKRQFARSDGSVSSTRRIFLTKVIDPFGNEVTLNYDSQLRLTNIVDAIGQATTLSYTNATYTNAITAVTDAFGRTAQFEYNASGLLARITDVLGLTSQFAYGANQFMTNLTTGYGTTTFATGLTNGVSYLMATDPLGRTERAEYTQNPVVSHTLPGAQVPHGLSTFNAFMDARNSFYWDHKAYAEGPGDYSKARNYHWLHHTPNSGSASPILESVKNPLEARFWFNYPGQPTNFGAPYYLDAAYSGPSDQPSVIARVLDDGTTQLTVNEYNASGNLTKTIDPVGRTFSFVYATNHLDLLEIRMTRAGQNELLRRHTFNAQHLPLTVTDASGQTTTNTYNARGQLVSTRNPLGEITTFTYATNGYLLSINGPLPGATNDLTLTYDSFGRVQSLTFSLGYTLLFEYDALDRPTRIVHPDGTFEQFVFDRLDLVALRDRLGQWTTNTYNAVRQIVQTRDPLSRITRFSWCRCGAPEAVTDTMGRTTTWNYDAGGRVLSKTYPDGSSVAYEYEPSRGLLKSRRDENGQLTVYDYYADENLRKVSFLNAVVPTPGITFTYDPDYDRVLTMQDGTGTTVFTYNPVLPTPGLGAGALQSVSSSLPNSAISFTYDELGRILSRSINGVAERHAYDALGRVGAVTNSLGAFHYGFADNTPQITMIAYPNGQTNHFAYYDNSGDRRLQRATHLKPDGSQLSGFGYAYDAAGRITSLTNEWDTLPARVWSYAYDAAGQLTDAVRKEGVATVASHHYSYDPAANRRLAALNGATNRFEYNSLNQLVTGDSPTNGLTYEWDGAQRLVAINQDARRTEFTYDGLDRRVRIVEKSNNVVQSDTRYLWSGRRLCEARDASGGTVLRRYFAQGEVITGVGGTTNLFYTRDHLNSVREAVDSTGILRARLDYDPFGQQTVLAAGLVPSFGYTGHLHHQPSGLNLTLYRAYDTRIARWLSRDPLEEAVGLNLYGYVGNDPVNRLDPTGECEVFCIIVIVAAAIVVGTYIGTRAKGDPAPSTKDYGNSVFQGPGSVDPYTIQFTADAMDDFAKSASYQQQQADQMRAYKQACGEEVKPKGGVADPLWDLLKGK